jgi:uncharacterized protein with HEPN domain
VSGPDPRDPAYLEHMLEAMARVQRYVGRKRRAGFLGDTLLQDAVIRNIEIVGEAARRVSPEFAARHAEIPWRDIVGMRHRLIHGYLNVNVDTVWDVVERDLPALAPRLRALLGAVRVPAVKRPVNKPRALRSRTSRGRAPAKRRR